MVSDWMENIDGDLDRKKKEESEKKEKENRQLIEEKKNELFGLFEDVIGEIEEKGKIDIDSTVDKNILKANFKNTKISIEVNEIFTIGGLAEAKISIDNGSSGSPNNIPFNEMILTMEGKWLISNRRQRNTQKRDELQREHVEELFQFMLKSFIDRK